MNTEDEPLVPYKKQVSILRKANKKWKATVMKLLKENEDLKLQNNQYRAYFNPESVNDD